MDNLCLPRPIVAAQAHIQHYKEKFLLRNAYQRLVGIKKSVGDKQGCLAKNLCLDCHIDTRLYQSGQKKFGLAEIKIFADFLAPKYGVAVFNSLTANGKVFQTEGTCKYWLNLLNLGQHFDVISGPAGFFGKNYWCEKCNGGYENKSKRGCKACYLQQENEELVKLVARLAVELDSYTPFLSAVEDYSIRELGAMHARSRTTAVCVHDLMEARRALTAEELQWNGPAVRVRLPNLPKVQAAIRQLRRQ